MSTKQDSLAIGWFIAITFLFASFFGVACSAKQAIDLRFWTALVALTGWSMITGWMLIDAFNAAIRRRQIGKAR
jgi:hypothetical protein